MFRAAAIFDGKVENQDRDDDQPSHADRLQLVHQVVGQTAAVELASGTQFAFEHFYPHPANLLSFGPSV